MRNELKTAAGYQFMFLVPALLLIGIEIGAPSFAFGVVIFVLPLARRYFGKLQPDDTPLWNERLASFLDRLPLAYAVVLTATVMVVLWGIAQAGTLSAGYAVGLGLSLWMTMLFATCVAHDLIHRRDRRQALVGSVVAGIAGYPLIAHEHLRHHAKAGSTTVPEWPRFNESVWQFAWRRAISIFGSAYKPSAAFWTTRAHSEVIAGLRVGTAATLTTLALFAWAGGWVGATIYLGVCIAVVFGMQLFTYIQHWGLGDDRLGAKASEGVGWEDDCRLQSWMTLGISLHFAHHEVSQWSYYRVGLKGTSPRLPAGYVVLMFVCLVPALWRKAMVPALKHWEQHPSDPRSPGRDLTCFHMYSTARAPRLNQ